MFPGGPKERFIAHACIAQVNVVHQMVKRHVRVETGHARHGGQRKTGKGGQGVLFIAKAGENQVKPDDIGLAVADRLQQPCVIAETIFFPAAIDIEVRQLRLRAGILIGQDRQTDQGIGL